MLVKGPSSSKAPTSALPRKGTAAGADAGAAVGAALFGEIQVMSFSSVIFRASIPERPDGQPHIVFRQRGARRARTGQVIKFGVLQLAFKGISARRAVQQRRHPP
ncbi:hypothetical protein D3C87_1337220 [compost metagenome]